MEKGSERLSLIRPSSGTPSPGTPSPGTTSPGRLTFKSSIEKLYCDRNPANFGNPVNEHF